MHRAKGLCVHCRTLEYCPSYYHFRASNILYDYIWNGLYGSRASSHVFLCFHYTDNQSSCPSDAIWQHRSGSILGQVMVWCLTAPSHNLNQYWLFISKFKYHYSGCKIWISPKLLIVNPQYYLKCAGRNAFHTSEFIPWPQRGYFTKEVNPSLAKPPSKWNGGLTKLGLTYFSKIDHFTRRVTGSVRLMVLDFARVMQWIHITSTTPRDHSQDTFPIAVTKSLPTQSNQYQLISHIAAELPLIDTLNHIKFSFHYHQYNKICKGYLHAWFISKILFKF